MMTIHLARRQIVPCFLLKHNTGRPDFIADAVRFGEIPRPVRRTANADACSDLFIAETVSQPPHRLDLPGQNPAAAIHRERQIEQHRHRVRVDPPMRADQPRELPTLGPIYATLHRKEVHSMTDNVENLILEHLKKIQAEQSAARERDTEILSRLSHMESGIARISRDESMTYGELIQDRHTVDKLKERIERIERRLEINN